MPEYLHCQSKDTSTSMLLSQDDWRHANLRCWTAARMPLDINTSPGYSKCTGKVASNRGTLQSRVRAYDRRHQTCAPGRPHTGELEAGESASLFVRLRLTGCLAFSGSSMRSRPSCSTGIHLILPFPVCEAELNFAGASLLCGPVV